MIHLLITNTICTTIALYPSIAIILTNKKPLLNLAKIKKDVDPNQLIEKANRHKIAILPDCLFSKNNKSICTIGLGFASLNELEMVSGIGRLKWVFASLH